MIDVHVEQGNKGRFFKTPKWLRGKAVCPVLLAGDLWWMDDLMIVRGGPPDGTSYTHLDPHIAPEGFGPTGDPVQVVGRSRDLLQSVVMVDSHGDLRARMDERVYDFLVDWFAPDTLKWLFYPGDPDGGDPNPVVGILHRQVMDEGPPQSMQELIAMQERGGPKTRIAIDIVCYVSPVIENLGFYLDSEDLAAIPRFSGMGDIGRHSEWQARQ